MCAHSFESLEKRRIRVREIDRAFHVAKHTPSSILDVGSGNGAIINAYSIRGFEAIGIEISESFVEQARE